MPIAPTYPGIYIEELPSSTNTITAAPTSITVIIGYTHPFKTLNFNTPILLFSFTDYENNFGGFFANAAYGPSDRFGSVAHAVNQFFLNGGSICYVVGLSPQSLFGSPPGPLQPASITLPPGAVTKGITFSALEPTDAQHQLTMTFSNLRSSSTGTNDTVDITMTYGSGPGSVFEKYRGVTLAAGSAAQRNPNFIESMIGTPTNQISSLVTVQPATPPPPNSPPGTNYPTSFPVPTSSSPSYTATFADAPLDGSVIFSEGDFTGPNGPFQANSPLDKLPIFNLLLLPGVTDNGILSAASAFCEQKLAFLIIDPPPPDLCSADGSNETGKLPNPLLPTIDNVVLGNVPSLPGPPLDKNCALYFPYIQTTDPVTGAEIDLPPSGTVAGIFAREDLNRGVWKAPAGMETTVVNSLGVVTNGQMNDQRQGVLNQAGVNCLRDFSGVGTVIFGARTLVTNNPSLSPLWRYVPVRRMALFLEQTLRNNLGWVVFEPNDQPLWNAIRTSISSFMLGLFRQQAFQGSTPSDAYQVKCDSQTTSQDDIYNGIVNIVVAFAPLKPAEFVIIQIAQLAGQAQT